MDPKSNPKMIQFVLSQANKYYEELQQDVRKIKSLFQMKELTDDEVRVQEYLRVTNDKIAEMDKKIETVKYQQHGVQEQCRTLKADIEKT